ncbi:helix-turn-helix transcriptional regulator [Terrabacter sp. MAHUQ-38]|uniref:response regulator transcription factor n=1 Tax=unclassified Terrabacter TaxID=2630222 RepID=UPI00165E721B|nr:helix-turn-helix transcriptional regulator [Terrabacter sp. MAHUQ-38]
MCRAVCHGHEGTPRLFLTECTRRSIRCVPARSRSGGSPSGRQGVGRRHLELVDDEAVVGGGIRRQVPGTAAGARLPREASGAPLTPQEDRIARLVAEGLSNKEIAARLVVSPKTVEGHLHNIFGKLGARCRAQVASRLLP